MTDIAQMNGPWLPGTKEYTCDVTLGGRADPGWGAILTAKQQMAMSVGIYAYKLNDLKKTVTKQYYALNGLMRHGVLHPEGAYDPGQNIVSVGYYATKMSLLIELVQPQGTAPGRVWEQGPNSTVGTETTSWNIGGGLSAMLGDQSGVGANASVGFSNSYSTPSVTIAEATVGTTVRWDLNLPGVGDGGSPNPKEPSYAGYDWAYGIIFEVDAGVLPSFRIVPTVEWHFDWTRGITNDVKFATRDEVWAPFSES